MRQARSGHWKSALTHRRPISGTCVINRIAPPPHHLNVHIKQIIPERRHGVLKDEKKMRSQNRIKLLVALLWGVHSGGVRESAGKKQGEKQMCAFFVVSVSFSSGGPSLRETHGGRDRPDTAQGPIKTCIRHAQGTGRRPWPTGGPFPGLVSSRRSPHHPTT